MSKFKPGDRVLLVDDYEVVEDHVAHVREDDDETVYDLCFYGEMDARWVFSTPTEAIRQCIKEHEQAIRRLRKQLARVEEK